MTIFVSCGEDLLYREKIVAGIPRTMQKRNDI